MSLLNFFRGNDGGFMDVIRCDKDDYLVHKWTPNGDVNSTAKENAIRYGSRLRLKPGESAVFFYNGDGDMQGDVLNGPLDTEIKTANFPVLSSIVGAAFGGQSPFAAEIYFFNRQENTQVKFGIPYFDIFDNRFPELGIPCAVRGTLTFSITDILKFIRLNRLIDFTLERFEEQIRDVFTRKIKAVIMNIPAETGLPVTQLERRLDEINTYCQDRVRAEVEEDFGITLKRLDLGAIELDTTHPHYLQLKANTADQQSRFIDAQTGIEITNLGEMARIKRKEAEMGVEGRNFAVHQLNLQADILKTAADNLGEMSNVDLGSGGGFSPLGIMTGLAVGGVMGNQMGNMMNNITSTPPPPPVNSYHIALNGQQSGPYSLDQLKEYAANGQFTKAHHVWKQGMPGWEIAEKVSVLDEVFALATPPPPPPTNQ
ncbi:MAG: SPFH domain-containing protein [Flavobacterium sp.]